MTVRLVDSRQIVNETLEGFRRDRAKYILEVRWEEIRGEGYFIVTLTSGLEKAKAIQLINEMFVRSTFAVMPEQSLQFCNFSRCDVVPDFEEGEVSP